MKLLFSLSSFLSLINNSIVFGLVSYPCQQYIPKELYLSLGYWFKSEISIIISCGKSELDSHKF